MKLTVHRSQSADAKRIIHFTAKFQLELTPQETDQINTYAQNDRIMGRIEDICGGTTVKAYISGLAAYENTSILKMIAVEEKIKEDVEDLTAFIRAASSYSGVEVLVATE